MPRAADLAGVARQAATYFVAALVIGHGGGALAQIPTEPRAAISPDAVVTGELFVEPPTLINLGFEWLIQGDDNRNASVAVSFRRQGAADWQPALPMLRLNGERIFSESRVDVIVPNMFAGSILDLEPDTAYEASVRSKSAPRRRSTVLARERAAYKPEISTSIT
jgi:hypothetical protein